MIGLLKSIGFAALFLFIFIIIWIILEMFLVMPVNNYRLHIIQNNFTDFNSQSFAQSRLLAKKADVDHWGNSNLCDYHVGQFRASSLSKEEIIESYKGLTIHSYKGDENSPLEIEIVFIDEWCKSNWYYWSEWWEDNSSKFSLASNETPYLVFASSNSHHASGDIRCH